jgi:hypothetical protein
VIVRGLAPLAPTATRTRPILAELGFADDEIDALLDARLA